MNHHPDLDPEELVVIGTATATFLFCDLVGSTALLTRVGDDRGDEVRRACFEVFREAIATHRGTEVKSTGDGILASFTVSVADAVAAGIAMQRGMARLAQANPLLELGLRVGVAVGEAAHEDGDWYGTPVVEAARLCDHARRGQILVSGVARALVGSRGGHRFTDLGVAALKGLEPIAVAEVDWVPETGHSALPLPGAIEQARGPALVGRRAERDAIEAVWHLVANGEGPRLVVLAGEDGIGRTRLAAEVARDAHADGATVLVGSGRHVEGAPYEPFAEALGWLAASAPADELASWLGPHAGELRRLVPDLGARLPADALGRPTAAARAGATVGPPGAARDRLQQAVASFLGAVGRAAPVLVVLDDLDQASPPAWALVAHLLDASETDRLLLVACVAEGTAELERFDGAARATVLHVRGLAIDDVSALLAARTGRAPADEAGTAARVHLETDGNPALIGQLLAGAAQGDDGLRVEVPCPYKGLTAFQPEDDELYFGRAEDISAALGRLGRSRFLAVVGPSGSGKSSLVRAGLVPALWRGALPGSMAWRTAILVPGADPVDALATELGRMGVADPAALVARLVDDPGALDLAAEQLLVGASDEARLLVVVDQFEELYTRAQDAAARDRFISLLVRAASTPGGRVSVVVTLRADLYGDAAGHPDLAPVLVAHQLLLGPLSAGSLRSVIERPAQHLHLRLEPAFVEEALRDVAAQPGGLPLLSHALRETWRRREGRTLTLAGYRDAGGVRGAIAQTAETTYAALPAADRAIARSVFLRLVEVGSSEQPSARRAGLDELLAVDPARVGPVLDALADARLVTLSDDGVQVAHEALLREWPQLRAWLDEDRDGLRLLSHLRGAALEWDRLGRDDGELYRGARLAATLEWAGSTAAPLGPREQAFLDAARDRESRELEAANEQVRRERATSRRLRVLVGCVGTVLVLALVAGGFAVSQRDRADAESARAQDRARDADLQRLISEIEPARTSTRDRAFLLALEADRLAPGPETASALLSTLQTDPAYQGQLRTTTGTTVTRATVVAGPRAVLGDADGQLHLFDLATNQPVGAPIAASAQRAPVRVLATSRGRERLAVGQRGVSEVTVFDVVDGVLTGARGVPVGGEPYAVAFGPGGTLVASLSPSGEVVAVDIATGARRGGVPGTGATRGVDVSAAGLVAVGSEDGVDLFELGSPSPLRHLAAEGSRADHSVHFDDDGTLLVTAGAVAESPVQDRRANQAELWDVGSGARRWRATDGLGRCVEVRLVPDGVLCAADESVVRLALEDGAVQGTVDAGANGTNGDARATTDGDRVFLTNGGIAELSTAQVWNLGGRAAQAPLVSGPGTYPVDFSADGRTLLVDGAEDIGYGLVAPGPRWLVDPMTGERLGDQLPILYGINAPDGRILSVFDDGSVGTFDPGSGDRRVVPVPDLANYTYVGIDSTGERAAVAYGDGSIRQFDLREGAEVEPVLHVDSQPTWVGYTDGDARVAVARNGELVLLDSASGEPVAGPVPAATAAISGDGSTLVVGTPDGGLVRRDPRTLAEVGPPIASVRTGIERMTISRDGRLLAVPRYDERLQLVDVEHGTTLGLALPLSGGIQFGHFVAAVSPGGRQLAVAGDEGVRVWDLDPAHWREQACRLAGRNLTRDEWERYLPAGEPYRATCRQWPAG